MPLVTLPDPMTQRMQTVYQDHLAEGESYASRLELPPRILDVGNGVAIPCARRGCGGWMELDLGIYLETVRNVAIWRRLRHLVAEVDRPPLDMLRLAIWCPNGHREHWCAGEAPEAAAARFNRERANRAAPLLASMERDDEDDEETQGDGRTRAARRRQARPVAEVAQSRRQFNPWPLAEVPVGQPA